MTVDEILTALEMTAAHRRQAAYKQSDALLSKVMMAIADDFDHVATTLRTLHESQEKTPPYGLRMPEGGK